MHLGSHEGPAHVIPSLWVPIVPWLARTAGARGACSSPGHLRYLALEPEGRKDCRDEGQKRKGEGGGKEREEVREEGEGRKEGEKEGEERQGGKRKERKGSGGRREEGEGRERREEGGERERQMKLSYPGSFFATFWEW